MSDGARHTVLVVDDDPDILELVCLRLRLDGHRVETAADGEAGLAAALRLVPDLLIVDWMMPRLTGVELCRRLRLDPRTERLPVLLLTSRSEEGDVRVALDAGVDEVVGKPFSPRELSGRAGALLARR